jgi:N,N'-diacetyllegionaminate synthase
MLETPPSPETGVATGAPRGPLLIAEIGNNHLGDATRATEMLTSVLASGVDSVTFQVREPGFYNAADTSQLKLPLDFFEEAARLAHAARCLLGIAICDQSLVKPLDAVGVDFWKTLSWDFRNEELRATLQATSKPVFYSTGVSGMEEVVKGSKGLRNAVLIHTQLSEKVGDVNLKAIRTMQNGTGLPIAFGLHCPNLEVLKLALAFEPHSIFFYVKMGGLAVGDDEHAVPVEELAAMVGSLRELAAAVGTGIKTGMETPAWVRANK